MTRPTLLSLILAYGDACFNTGEWQKDDQDRGSYDVMFDRQQEALKKVEAAIGELPLEEMK